MANVTPFATPKGGFPLVLTTETFGGNVVSVTFPTSAAVNPNNAAAEAEFKKMLIVSAADTLVAACT